MDISGLIAVVQIEYVRVVEAHLRTSIKSPHDVGHEIEGKIGHAEHIVQSLKNGVFSIRIDFVFGVHSKGEQAKDNSSAPVAVNVSFELSYRVPESMSVSDEELMEFARVNGVFNAWPYFREFVHAALSRMGLPPVIIPVFRLSRPKPSSAKSVDEPTKRSTPKRNQPTAESSIKH